MENTLELECSDDECIDNLDERDEYDEDEGDFDFDNIGELEPTEAVQPTKFRDNIRKSSMFSVKRTISPPLPLMKFKLSEDRSRFASTLIGERIETFDNGFGIPISSFPRGSIPDSLSCYRDKLQNPLRARLLMKWFMARGAKENYIRQLESLDSIRREKNGAPCAEGESVESIVDTTVYNCPNFKPGKSDDPSSQFTDRGRDSNLMFDANFESGNLHKATRVTGRENMMSGRVLDSLGEYAAPASVAQEYDLILRKDLYTDGNVQWYYFSASTKHIAGTTPGISISVSNSEVSSSSAASATGCIGGGGPVVPVYPLAVRFNLINMQKNEALYNYGMKPATCILSSANTAESWRHRGVDVCYYKNAKKESAVEKKKGKSKRLKKGYSLSFTYVFQGPETVFFAHTYPYTYTDLQRYLCSLDEDERIQEFTHRSLLCHTIAGNRCDLITISSKTNEALQQETRPAIVISARVHPGESNSSYIMHGIIEFLTSDCAEAKLLRDSLVFKIVPMLNPDGVIHGNYRCSLGGTDLNRRYLDTHSSLHPTIAALKSLLQQTQERRKILLFLDLHGHSKKKNAFVYGCDIPYKPNIPGNSFSGYVQGLSSNSLILDTVQLRRVHSRMFPKLLCNLSNSTEANGYFCFKDCEFNVIKSKLGTGRLYSWRTLNIEGAYTIEVSFCSGGNNKESKLLKIFDGNILFFESFLRQLRQRTGVRSSRIRSNTYGGSDGNSRKSSESSDSGKGSRRKSSVAGTGTTEAIGIAFGGPRVLNPSNSPVGIIRKQSGSLNDVLNPSGAVCLVSNESPSLLPDKVTQEQIEVVMNAMDWSSFCDVFKNLSQQAIPNQKAPSPNPDSTSEADNEAGNSGASTNSFNMVKHQFLSVIELIKNYPAEYHYIKEDYKNMGRHICEAIIHYANLGAHQATSILQQHQRQQEQQHYQSHHVSAIPMKNSIPIPHASSEEYLTNFGFGILKSRSQPIASAKAFSFEKPKHFLVNFGNSGRENVDCFQNINNDTFGESKEYVDDDSNSDSGDEEEMSPVRRLSVSRSNINDSSPPESAPSSRSGGNSPSIAVLDNLMLTASTSCQVSLISPEMVSKPLVTSSVMSNEAIHVAIDLMAMVSKRESNAEPDKHSLHHRILCELELRKMFQSLHDDADPYIESNSSNKLEDLDALLDLSDGGSDSDPSVDNLPMPKGIRKISNLDRKILLKALNTAAKKRRRKSGKIRKKASSKKSKSLSRRVSSATDAGRRKSRAVPVVSPNPSNTVMVWTKKPPKAVVVVPVAKQAASVFQRTSSSSPCEEDPMIILSQEHTSVSRPSSSSKAREAREDLQIQTSSMVKSSKLARSQSSKSKIGEHSAADVSGNLQVNAPSSAPTFQLPTRSSSANNSTHANNAASRYHPKSSTSIEQTLRLAPIQSLKFGQNGGVLETSGNIYQHSPNNHQMEFTPGSVGGGGGSNNNIRRGGGGGGSSSSGIGGIGAGGNLPGANSYNSHNYSINSNNNDILGSGEFIGALNNNNTMLGNLNINYVNSSSNNYTTNSNFSALLSPNSQFRSNNSAQAQANSSQPVLISNQTTISTTSAEFGGLLSVSPPYESNTGISNSSGGGFGQLPSATSSTRPSTSSVRSSFPAHVQALMSMRGSPQIRAASPADVGNRALSSNQHHIDTNNYSGNNNSRMSLFQSLGNSSSSEQQRDCMLPRVLVQQSTTGIPSPRVGSAPQSGRKPWNRLVEGQK